jgi:hypothetical protein
MPMKTIKINVAATRTGDETRLTPVLWAVTFVPFGLGLIAALMLAELTQDLRLFRTINAIRLSLALSILALALFPHRSRSPAVRNAWKLLWTFGFLAFAVHFLYAWFGVFGGQLATARDYPKLFHVAGNPTILDLVRAHQGDFVAFSNLAVTGLWLLDVVLAWSADRARGFLGGLVQIFHVLIWVYVLVSFGIATVYFYKNDIAYTMGWVLVGSVGASVLAALTGRLSRNAAAGADYRGG